LTRPQRKIPQRAGYALYAFDLTADLGKDHFSLVRQGSVRLALKSVAALAATVTAVTYAELENVIEVDREETSFSTLGYEYCPNQPH